ncbi:hypothetical protein pb186bvf_002068 [Paramecium bursaria]
MINCILIVYLLYKSSSQNKKEDYLDMFKCQKGLQPQQTDALLGNRFILFRKAQFDKAIEAFDQYIKLEPENIQAFNGKGRSLYKLGNYREAIKAFDIVNKKILKRVQLCNKKYFVINQQCFLFSWLIQNKIRSITYLFQFHNEFLYFQKIYF